jgi:hypothetical protein
MVDTIGPVQAPVSFDPPLLQAAARLARLPLSDDRAAALLPALDGVFQMLAALDQASLGETAPAFSFKARWEA